MTFNCQRWNSRNWNEQCRLIPITQPDNSIIFGNCIIQQNDCCATCSGGNPLYTSAVDYWNPASREIFVDSIPDEDGQNLLSDYFRVKTTIVRGTIIVCDKCELENAIDNLKACLRCPNQKLKVKRCGKVREMVATWIATESTFAVQEHFNITHIDYNLTFRSTKGNPYWVCEDFTVNDFLSIGVPVLSFSVASAGTAPAEPNIIITFNGSCDSIDLNVANNFRVYIPGPFSPLDVVEIDKQTKSVKKNGVEIDWFGSIRDIQPGNSAVTLNIFNLVGTYNLTFKYKDSYL